MAIKITKQTRINIGDIIAYETAEGLAVYQVAKIERKKDWNHCICLNHSPGDKEFIKENKVDWYTRIYQSDLIKHQKAKIISVIELITLFDHLKIVILDLKNKLKDVDETFN